MTLEGKLKKAAIIAAVDISLKRMGNSPERCARNLMELGNSAYPGRLTKREQTEFLSHFMAVCKNKNIPEARALFIHIFFE